MAATAPAPTAHCARCGRTLRSAASIAAGYGPTCARRIREATKVVDLTAYKTFQVEKAADLIEDGGIIRLTRAGDYAAVSSNGADHYLINIHNRTCTCRAGERGLRCYHLAAATVLAAA